MTPHFSIPLALEMARWARYAYPACRATMPTPAKVIPIDSTATDCHAIFAQTADYNVLAIAGTQSVKNMWEDAEIAFTHWLVNRAMMDGSKFHYGFGQDWNSIRPRILPLIDRTSFKSLYFTFHSLGAGMGKIGALDMRVNYGITPTAVISFGEPRFGNRKAAHLYDRLLGSRTWRVRNHDDGIAKVALFTWGGFFWHTRNMMLMNSSGRHKLNPSRLYTLKSDLHGFYVDLLQRRWSDIYDHGIDRYIADLQALDRKSKLAPKPSALSPSS